MLFISLFQLFQLVLDITQQLSVSAQGVHVALVHFSSPDSSSAVSFTLDQGTSLASANQTIQALSYPAMLGVSDLDLCVPTAFILLISAVSR